MLLSFFDNLDVVKILGFGLSGLCLLLMVLTYQLLRRIIEIPNPNTSVIALIKWFMGITVLVLVVVGIFSFPLLNKNQQLANDNKSLVISSEVNARLDTLKQTVDINKQAEQLKKIKAYSDSLATSVPDASPALEKQVQSFKNEVDDLVITTNQKKIKGDTAGFFFTKDAMANRLKNNFNQQIYVPLKKEIKLRQ